VAQRHPLRQRPRLGAAWEDYSERLDRLTVRGAKKGVLDLAGEALTLGVAGGIVVLWLALPAFRETTDNWLKAQELAVTFLDRYGQEVGRRGIRHDDSVKLEDYPDHLIKAALATEDRRFFEHWGIDPIGTVRAMASNARGGQVQGGSSITQQLAKNCSCRTSARWSARSRKPFSRSGSSSTCPRTRS
jgi:penicillin-binding protein 1A